MKQTSNFGARLSGRSVIGDTLHSLGGVRDNLFVLTPDIGGALGAFRRDFPDRYIDVGVAEQNVMGVAAGLALEGNIPVVMGMIPFLTMRACEQIRSCVCYQNLPVRIIGTGGGLTSGGGSTHNAMEDIAIMRSLVNMTVVSIGDPHMIRDVLTLSMEYPSPMFIRLAQGKSDRVLYEPGSANCQPGQSIIPREGDDICLFAHGEMVFEALEAASRAEKEGIGVQVVDLFSIKPIDKETILSAAQKTRRFVVLEDHLAYGGAASAIADVLADNGVTLSYFKRLGIPQVYAGFGSGPELRRKYGYDQDAALEALREGMSVSK